MSFIKVPDKIKSQLPAPIPELLDLLEECNSNGNRALAKKIRADLRSVGFKISMFSKSRRKHAREKEAQTV